MLATAVAGAAGALAGIIPMSLFTQWALAAIKENGTKEEMAKSLTVFTWRSVVCGILFLATSFLLVIPASVSLTRVQASLLPAEEEPIVPFDHTYGGRVISRDDGGNGIVGFFDAWRTFAWNSRVRLVWAYAKFGLLSVALTFVFAAAFITELYYFVPKEAQEKIAAEISAKM